MTVEAFDMLGDTIAAVKQAARTIIADDALLGAIAGKQEISLTQIAAAYGRHVPRCKVILLLAGPRWKRVPKRLQKCPENPGGDHAELW